MGVNFDIFYFVVRGRYIMDVGLIARAIAFEFSTRPNALAKIGAWLSEQSEKSNTYVLSR